MGAAAGHAGCFLGAGKDDGDGAAGGLASAPDAAEERADAQLSTAATPLCWSVFR